MLLLVFGRHVGAHQDGLQITRGPIKHKRKHTTKRTTTLPLPGIAALVKLANNQRSEYKNSLLMMLMPSRKFVHFTSLILELLYI